MAKFFDRLKHFFYEKTVEPHHTFKKLLGLRYHEVSNPETVRNILSDQEHFAGPRFQRKMAGTLIGDALINAEGASWERQRKLFQGFFSAKSVIDNTGPIIVEESHAMVNRWLANKETDKIDVEHELRLLTGRVIIRSIFGKDIKDQDANDIIETISSATIQTIRGLSGTGVAIRAAGLHKVVDALGAAGGAMPDYYTSPEYEAMKEKIDGIIYSIIDARRTLPQQPDDLLGAMLSPSDGQPPMSNKEIRDEIVMFIVAGHDTTSVGLTFSLLEALKHPAELQKIQDEIAAVTNNGTREIDPHDFMKLPTLHKVIKEAIRLHPPSHAVGKEATADVTVDGIDFKKGDIVKVSLPDALQSPDFWQGADTYSADRMPTGFKTEPNFVAFGHGPRKCPGMSLSFAEGALSLADIFSKVSLKIVQEPEGEDHNSFSTRIMGKAICQVTPKAKGNQPTP